MSDNDRRYQSRVSVEYPVRVRYGNDNGDFADIHARTIDVSETGMGFEIEETLPEQKVVVVSMVLPNQQELLLQGQVVWQKRSVQGYHSGIRFLIDGADDLLEIVYTLRRKTYCMNVTVYLKDTNVFGNTYFSRYFEWQGIAREGWFTLIKDYQRIMRSGLKLITRRAAIEYEEETLPFDVVEVKLQTKNIRRCSFDLVFTCVNKRTGHLCARGTQTITVADSGGKITRLPYGLLNLASNYLEK